MWCGMVPPRVEFFFWLTAVAKISTVNNLRRRGILSEAILDICVLCGKEEESINHLFMHCDSATYVWRFFYQEMLNFMVYAKGS